MSTPANPSGVLLSFWRAAALFRVVALAVCVVLIVRWQPIYARPSVASAAAAAMVVLTALFVLMVQRVRALGPTLVAIDIVVSAGLTLLSIPAQTLSQQHGGMVTLTTVWAAGPTIEAGIVAGPLGGLGAAAVQYGVTAAIAETGAGRTAYSGVLLLVAGAVIGFVARVAVRAEGELRRAAVAQAAVAERERLALSVHDGVLQVLGLVNRTGAEAGGTWGELAAAAAEQEAALRALISSRAAAADAGEPDLSGRLRALAGERVTVSVPAEPVPLTRECAAELAAAVRAALHNVAAHAGEGAHAWVLVETLAHEVRVTVRDDGVGFAPGRLAQAERAGRLGVARSMRSRLTALGGDVRVESAVGAGTEVEFTVPRDTP